MLSELEEYLLLTLWKLRGIGNNRVSKEVLRANLTVETSAETWLTGISSLADRGFLQTATINGEEGFSLTPLGLSLIRQIEEDKLQELK